MTVLGRCMASQTPAWSHHSRPLLCLSLLMALQFWHAEAALQQLETVEDLLHSQLTSFELLQPARLVSRRSLSFDASPTRHLHFTAFNRQFHLVLQPDHSHAVRLHSLAVKLIAQNGSSTELGASELLEDFCTGFLDDQPDSRVSGYTDGHRFHLTVYERNYSILNIEPLSLLTGNQSEDRTLVYYDSSMNSSELRCGVQDSSGDQTSSATAADALNRFRRSADAANDSTAQTSTHRRVCRLQVVADHAFVNHIGSVSAALKLLIKTTDDVNKIYLDTVFTTRSGTANFTSISFELSKLVAMTGPSVVPASEAFHFNSANTKDEVSANHLLEAFADFEQNGLDLASHCLSHLIAFRPLKKKLLGLAYQGSRHKAHPGGICSRPSLSMYGRNRFVARNVGLTTFCNHKGETIPTRQATLVMAHELAHNLGSTHDPAAGECNPGLERGGHFLMHVKAVTGKDINHSKLSVCSRRSIADVLESREAECFSNQTGQVCGNGRQEVGEECDAGPIGDVCCRPDCQLRPDAACSDANSACCRDCQLAPAGLVCRHHRPLWPCRSDAQCDGWSPACPAAEAAAPLPNGTSCLRGLGACIDGDCLSRCQLVGKTDCTCPLPADACSQCCRGGAGDECAVLRHADKPVQRPDCPEPANPVGGGLTARLWGLVGRFSGESLGSILRCNVVLIVVFLSLLVWVPACCISEYRIRRAEVANTEVPLTAFS